MSVNKQNSHTKATLSQPMSHEQRKDTLHILLPSSLLTFSSLYLNILAKLAEIFSRQLLAQLSWHLISTLTSLPSAREHY